MPRLNGRRTTCAPCSAATSAVRSADPSETTTTSRPGSKARNSSTTPPIACSSLNAGTIAIRRSGSADMRFLPQTEQCEQLPRAVPVGVLVEHSLARAAAELLRLCGIGEQLAVRARRLLRVVDDDQLGAWLEPALDAVVRIRDDCRTRGSELERTARRRRVHRRVRAARNTEVDARGGDRVREGVERHVADLPRTADVTLEVAPAEREVGIGQHTRRLADHRLHPVAPELVAVAVEEDVHRLLDGVRCEELRVGAPEDRLCPARSEIEQPLGRAVRVRDEEVVL